MRDDVMPCDILRTSKILFWLFIQKKHLGIKRVKMQASYNVFWLKKVNSAGHRFNMGRITMIRLFFKGNDKIR